MKQLLRDENIEYIARQIGGLYSGSVLVEKLKRMGIPDEVIVYPNTKWIMVADVLRYFNNMSSRYQALKFISKIIELLIHPVNENEWSVSAEQQREHLEKRLAYDNLQIKQQGGDFILYIHEKNKVRDSFSLNECLEEIIGSFKSEYSKHKINGSKYLIYLGQGISSEMTAQEIEKYNVRKEAIDILKKNNIIKSYEIIEKIEEYYDEIQQCVITRDSEIWLAKCLINEDLLNKEKKRALVSMNDHVLDIIKILKEEYKKYLPIKGLSYDVFFSVDITTDEKKIFQELRKKAMDLIVETGIVKSYEIFEADEEFFNKDGKLISRNTNNYFFKCLVDENLLSNNGNTEQIIKHIHEFKNSIQEKDINIKYKDIENPSIILFKSSQEDNKYYFQINNDIKIDLIKSEYEILNKFYNNNDLISKDIFMPKESYRNSFDSAKTRINKKFKKHNLKLDSTSEGGKTFYIIRKI
jgi:hypothetical protein